MGGRRPGEAFNANPDTGRMAFRYDWEPLDERPCVIYTEPFWAGPEEEARWLRAVGACPLSEYGHMDVFAYLRAVGEVATGLRGEVKAMPRPGLSRRERDARLATLRGQMDERSGNR